MDHKEVLKRVDHTLLTQAATWDEVKTVCDEGIACALRPCASRPAM